VNAVTGEIDTVRLVDLEYQWWLNFPFGTLRPYGASTGIAVHFH
jgi:hypothetical protein